MSPGEENSGVRAGISRELPRGGSNFRRSHLAVAHFQVSFTHLLVSKAAHVCTSPWPIVLSKYQVCSSRRLPIAEISEVSYFILVLNLRKSPNTSR